MVFARLPPPGYELQSRDSTYWAEELQFAHWRSLDLPAKVRLIEDWHAAMQELQVEALRREHPHAPAAELARLAAEARYGREFVRTFLGYRPAVPPGP